MGLKLSSSILNKSGLNFSSQIMNKSGTKKHDFNQDSPEELEKIAIDFPSFKDFQEFID